MASLPTRSAFYPCHLSHGRRCPFKWSECIVAVKYVTPESGDGAPFLQEGTTLSRLSCNNYSCPFFPLIKMSVIFLISLLYFMLCLSQCHHPENGNFKIKLYVWQSSSCITWFCVTWCCVTRPCVTWFCNILPLLLHASTYSPCTVYHKTLKMHF